MFHHCDQTPEVNSLKGFILAQGFRDFGPVAVPVATQDIMTEACASGLCSPYDITHTHTQKKGRALDLDVSFRYQLSHNSYQLISDNSYLTSVLHASVPEGSLPKVPQARHA